MVLTNESFKTGDFRFFLSLTETFDAFEWTLRSTFCFPLYLQLKRPQQVTQTVLKIKSFKLHSWWHFNKGHYKLCMISACSFRKHLNLFTVPRHGATRLTVKSKANSCQTWFTLEVEAGTLFAISGIILTFILRDSFITLRGKLWMVWLCISSSVTMLVL